MQTGLAGLVVGGAPTMAQTVGPPATFSQGQVPTRPASKPPAGANDGNNSAADAESKSVQTPTPGTVVIHINGRILTEVGGAWSSLDAGTFPNAGGNGGPAAATGRFELQPTSLTSYARIYTGLDAMAANGMRYGGAIEIRENFTGQTSTAASTGASGYSSSETLFVRRAFAYVAADSGGILRAGQGDGLISLYDDGVTTFQFLPSNNLQGGDIQDVMPSNVTVPFAFLSGSGNEYANTKLVYLSPQFAGIDVGVQWAPNTSNGFGTGASATGSTPGCPVAGSGCPGLSSSPVPGDGARALNQTAVGVRYRGSAGPVDVLAYGVYEFSGHTAATGPPVATGSAAQRASDSGTGRFDGLSFGNAGIALTYAGLTIGGNWIGGAVNGQGALRPSGGADLQGWLVGASYKAGPFTVGGSFESIDSQGAPQLVGISQRHEIGVDVGASYVVAPGLVGWIEYLYQQRHQGGFNFAAGSAVSDAGAYNDVKGQGLQIGTTIFW
ncbi:MAG: hypothetical protein BGO51_17990 [Rhodospirillales bacterium 69-11]|nr:MAG: hypothetical protein BGO51_17990 [Rhodospirillales bacterium 69-11]